MNDKEVILAALQRERDELHDKIMQVDRIIKRVKGIEAIDTNNMLQENVIPITQSIAPVKTIPLDADIKIQVLRVFDVIGKASKLKDLQHQYFQLTGNAYNIREVIRSLNRQHVIFMAKDKRNHRGVLWVKRDWVRNGLLMDEFKPEGFDLFYQASNLIYE